MITEKPRLYTIGYAPHTLESFAQALERHGVQAVADVRSEPYSAHRPEFNREPLNHYLRARGLAYVFLGDALGARCLDSSAWIDGRVDYERVAGLPHFQQGLERLRQGLRRYSVALLCAEKDPMTCHRSILVCRQLRNEADIRHILADGGLESHSQMENRLIQTLRLDQCALPGLENNGSALDEAYRRQGRAIAFHLDEAEMAAETA
jgi:uncharacterized protein (DUF488 family)